jgi:hypothetical protein
MRRWDFWGIGHRRGLGKDNWETHSSLDLNRKSSLLRSTIKNENHLDFFNMIARMVGRNSRLGLIGQPRPLRAALTPSALKASKA